MAAAAAIAVFLVIGAFDLNLIPVPFFAISRHGPFVSADIPRVQIYQIDPSPTADDGLKKEALAKSVKPTAATRIVKKGDTILQLIRDTYHVREPRRLSSLLLEVMRNNPDIKDASYIFEGQKLIFPDTKRETLEASK